ncbi:MAG TPA: carbonic anhydrase [Terriglobales bacterium]|nr:carbonic anhydrase [Terriglobales bacterium]
MTDLAPRNNREVQRDLFAQLMEGHQRFLAGDPTPKTYPFLGTLAAVQKPVATVLGCSDSRVSPELVFDQGFGDLFVVRSAGHTVDLLTLGSLEFAVEIVNSPLLIIMGHEDCRAVYTALTKTTAGTANIQQMVDLVKPSLMGMKETTDLVLAVKAHILKTAATVLEKSPVINQRVQQRDLKLAKLFYHVTTGEIEVL